VIRKVREEFPPLAIDPELATALSALRAERERQGLSLSDVLERSGIDRATLSKLETEGPQSHRRYAPGPGPRPQQAAVVVADR
jgi:hypothetical protein